MPRRPPMTVLVTGGTGSLGRALVPALARAGEVRVLSRRPSPRHGLDAVTWVGGDLVTGAGLEEALDGVTVVVHAATDARHPSRDLPMARNLLSSARRTGSPHVVDVSIVGIDRIPLPYYRTKLEVEQLVAASGLPWTVLRATQFHGLVLALVARLAGLPVVPVPAQVSFQPVDVRDVAERLTAIAAGQPLGRAPELGGPEVLGVAELVRTYTAESGRRPRPQVTLPLPGRIARGFRLGANLTPDHASGRRTFREFLAEPQALGGDRRPPG